LKLIELVRPRARRLGDFVEIARPLLVDAFEVDPAAVEMHLSSPDLGSHLDALSDEWSRLESFDEATLERVLRDLAAARGLKAGTLIHAVRVAVTGRAVSPGLFEVLALLGRAKSLARLDEARRRLR
jgi:glutamyl-tRNA synthetase